VRIIILNQFFYPDHSATAQLMTELAESLTDLGVEVTALSACGSYNGGKRLAARENYRGILIERAWSTSFGKSNLVARISDYLSFYLGSLWKLIFLPRHEIVMVLTTPPLIGLVALLAGRARGMRVVAVVQDVYPEIAVALGALRPRSLLTRFLSRLDRVVLRDADRIIVLAECMRERILAKVGEDLSSRIAVIHNWADGEKIKPVDQKENPFCHSHNLRDRFVVLFSGNLGRVNEFSTVLEAAERLRHRSDILFLFIGEGAKADEIRRFSVQHPGANIRMLPYQPRELLGYSLAAGHVSLVTLAEGLAGLSVPSKTYGILAAGRPVLFVGDTQSDLARLIRENGCGAVVPSGNSQRLAAIIEEWESDRTKLDRLGSSARALFEKRFERARAVDSYLAVLNRSLAPDSSPAETRAKAREATP
jgi:colanic acid biosynthesis glycosyl transferase WcaI